VQKRNNLDAQVNLSTFSNPNSEPNPISVPWQPISEEPKGNMEGDVFGGRDWNGGGSPGA